MSSVNTGSFPHFDQPVPSRGYQWWYVDASNADGSEHLVMIAFVGSVFSPWYGRACDAGPADPMDFCALNVALYRKGGKRWALTEIPRAEITREKDTFGLGPSSLTWRDDKLVIDVKEREVPLPRAMAGRIVVTPQALTPVDRVLDRDARHHWWPLAPQCDVEVSFDKPDWRWRGRGYFDSNRGSEPLQDGFLSWNWSRQHVDGGSLLTYNALPRSGEPIPLALNISDAGEVSEQASASPQRLKTGLWGITGEAAVAAPVKSLKLLEDTPFYTRGIVTLEGGEALMHESLNLTRFCKPWVRFLLPFRTRNRR
ncbi:MAG: carotenoid 1,2-hydratase [Pseudomonadota bacterium]